MLNYQVKIGLVALRRDNDYRPPKTFLAWESAENRGERFVKYIKENFSSEKVSFVDTRGIGIKNLVFDDASAQDCIERFKAEKVDAVFIINCNFGNEAAAADIAKAMGLPVLIWAPLDDEYYENGIRPTDSQCGLFAVSRQMLRLHVPFSHLPCCEVESDEFKEGFESFIRVACMVKNFKGLRIGQIGLRPGPFFSVIWNEGELLEKFGVKIIPINFTVMEKRMKAVLEENPPEVQEIEDHIRRSYQLDEISAKHVHGMAAYVVTIKRLFEEFRLDAISAECWSAVPNMFDGLRPCVPYAILYDMGYLVSCESDMNAVLTTVLLECATLGEGKPLFGEFTVRHPQNRNVELLWHCGPFPISQKTPSGVGSTAKIIDQKSWFRAVDGEYTVARLDQASGDYMILPLICRSTEGPQTQGNYFWAEFEDLQKVEDRLLDGPYIHHFVEMRGDYRKEIREFCKFIPNLKLDTSI
ncbi:MAG: hypothetical protein IJM26_07465 [Lachnospiraceae bacterium]|nr:hypothetical protein [Lachnospiraceae bacterium]